MTVNEVNGRPCARDDKDRSGTLDLSNPGSQDDSDNDSSLSSNSSNSSDSSEEENNQDQEDSKTGEESQDPEDQEVIVMGVVTPSKNAQRKPGANNENQRTFTQQE